MKQLHQFDEVFDSQKTFRRILDAMANPFRKININDISKKMYGDYPHMLTIAMTLLNNEVSYYVCGDEELSEQVNLLTHAINTDCSEADYIFVTDSKYLENVIEQAKSGTLVDPHKGAVIIIYNDGLEDVNESFYGPGINGIVNISMTKTMINSIYSRDSQIYEYPTGIDFMFVTEDGTVQCIPRLVRKEQ